MPTTYAAETDDGRTVYVTLQRQPIGVKALIPAVQAEVNAGRFSETPPAETPTPGSMVRDLSEGARAAYADIAGRVTRGVSGLIQGGGNALQAEALPGMALAGAPLPTERPPLTTSASDTLAMLAVPQTLTEAGMMAGTAGVGGLAAKLGLTGVRAAGARILGSAIGGEAGNVLEGGPLGLGALEGAATAGAGETLGGTYSFLRKSLPGGMTAISQQTLDDFRNTVATYLPGILRPKNASEMKRLVRSGGLLNAAGDRYTDSVQRASNAMGNNPINVPALADAPTPKASITTMLKDAGYSDTPITPDMAVDLPADAKRMLVKTTARMTAGEATDYLANAGYGQKLLPLAEAVERLKVYGQSGYSGTKEMRADRTLAGRPSREQWETALQEIRSEIQRFNPTGEALAIFDAGRRDYAVASTIHGILKSDAAYLGVPNDVRFNPNGVRALWERKFQKVQNAVPADEFAAIEDALYQGGPFGSRDLLRGGADTLTAAAAQMQRHGGGFSSGAMLAPRSVLPGGGNLLTGRQPFALSPTARAGLDLGVQGITLPAIRELQR